MKLQFNDNKQVVATAETAEEATKLIKLATDKRFGADDVRVALITKDKPRRKYKKSSYKKECVYCGGKFKGVKLHITKAHAMEQKSYSLPTLNLKQQQHAV